MRPVRVNLAGGSIPRWKESIINQENCQVITVLQTRIALAKYGGLERRVDQSDSPRNTVKDEESFSGCSDGQLPQPACQANRNAHSSSVIRFNQLERKPTWLSGQSPFGMSFVFHG